MVASGVSVAPADDAAATGASSADAAGGGDIYTLLVFSSENVERCSTPVQQVQKSIQHVMQDFQVSGFVAGYWSRGRDQLDKGWVQGSERFQRCSLRCQDSAREVAGFDPSPSDEARAKDTFLKCVDSCGMEFEGKVPKLKQDILGQLRKLV
ncbi:hypothetical protein QJQ45_021434 [Haematococcus lacustris]|nr:hypothetical protein QJQ45_021434 [Haematococcus lacustris]